MALSIEGTVDVKDMIHRSQMLRREPTFLPKTQGVFILFEENSEDKSLLCVLHPALLHQGSVGRAHVAHRRYRLHSLFHPCTLVNCSSRLLTGWCPQ